MRHGLSLILCCALSAALGSLRCKDAADAPALGGETNWFRWCNSDAECVEGACVCGVCTRPCDEGTGSCAEGPPNSACFASGSIGHAALCQSDELAGICLASCATSRDCTDGFQCVVGACVPSAAALLERPAPSASGAGTESAAMPATDPTRPDMFLVPYPEDLPGYGREVGYASLCSPDAPCPTLEEVLRMDSCEQVVTGCGLWAVHARGAFSYWYEGFGSPPVGVGNWGGADIGGAMWSTTRSLECGTVDVMCSTCGDVNVRCEDLPGWLPELPEPAPVAGCACEPDGANAARVSMECFCSLYDCPSYSPSLLDCPADPDDVEIATVQSTSSCGQIWFNNAARSGQRFAYDPSSGELVAAEAFSQGPVTAPCNTYRVSAGDVRACDAPQDCSCNGASPAYLVGRGIEMESCNDAAWFQGLSNVVPPNAP